MLVFMTTRLGDVLVAQHRFVLQLVDDLQRARATRASFDAAGHAVLAHLAVEEEVLSGPLEAAGARHLHEEEHATVRFALERVRLRVPKLLAHARLRVLRELLIHHIEPEERVALPAIERRIGRSRSLVLGRKAKRAFAALLARPPRAPDDIP